MGCPPATWILSAGAHSGAYDKVDVPSWVVLIVATLITLFFSLVHYTLRSPSRVRLEQAFAGRRRNVRLDRIERGWNDLVLVTAIVRTLCHLLIVVVLFHNLSQPEGWWDDVLTMAIAAALVTVFGNGIPHAWAKYGGEFMLPVLWPALMISWVLLWPVIGALKAMDVPVRRLSGHREESNGRTSELEQEILQLASEGSAGGHVDPDEMEMISSVIEFHDMKASEIMTPRTEIEAVPVDADRARCTELILRVGHSRIPVYEETLDKVVGVLYAKDMLNGGGEPFELRSVMRKPYFVPETKAVSDLLNEFRAQKVHMAIVLDEYGGTAGLITIEDLLEELVGDIADEYEPAEPEMFTLVGQRIAEIDARMYIDDLNDELDIRLPEEEDYDTVGGFVFSTLGYIPEAGQEFDYNGVHFTVLEAEERKIKRIRVAAPPEEDAEEED